MSFCGLPRNKIPNKLKIKIFKYARDLGIWTSPKMK